MTDAQQPPILPMPHPNPEWLARLKEDVLEPGLPIIDPHHHLWDRPGNRYFLDDLLADTETGGHNVVATVFLQCGAFYREDGPEEWKPLGETEYVAGVAAESERRRTQTRACAAIMGHVDLRLGEDAEPLLRAHMDAGGGRFRGIRHVTARDAAFLSSVLAPQPFHLMADPVFRQGFAILGKLDLSFDAWLYHTQIDELTDLARAFPAIPIVLDHVGGPLGTGPYRGKSDEVFAAWSKSIRALAGCPNVSIKLGGLAMAVNGFDFQNNVLPPSSGELVTAWRPFMETCIEAFGANRCMFESNFPVDKAMCSYTVLWNAFKRLAHAASANEKAAMFHDTAAKFYRIAA